MGVVLSPPIGTHCSCTAPLFPRDAQPALLLVSQPCTGDAQGAPAGCGMSLRSRQGWCSWAPAACRVAEVGFSPNSEVFSEGWN